MVQALVMQVHLNKTSWGVPLGGEGVNVSQPEDPGVGLKCHLPETLPCVALSFPCLSVTGELCVRCLHHP